MATNVALLEKVSELSVQNDQLRAEVDELNKDRSTTENQFQADVRALNELLTRVLPSATRVLLLETPPSRRQSIAGRIWSLACWSVFGVTQIHSVEELGWTISDFRKAENKFRCSQQEAQTRSLQAADLASRAAIQSAHCSSVAKLVDDAKGEAEAQLKRTAAAIQNAHSRIQENQRLSSSMESEASYHENQRQEWKDIAKYTWFVPVVNLITCPAALIAHSHHSDRLGEYRSVIANCQAEIRAKEHEMPALTARTRQLDEILTPLKVAFEACVENQQQSTQSRDYAKVLTDQYSMVTAKISQAVQALDYIPPDIDLDKWDGLRFEVLQALLGMMESLDELGVLGDNSAKCLDVLRSADTQAKEWPLGERELEW